MGIAICPFLGGFTGAEKLEGKGKWRGEERGHSHLQLLLALVKLYHFALSSKQLA